MAFYIHVDNYIPPVSNSQIFMLKILKITETLSQLFSLMVTKKMTMSEWRLSHTMEEWPRIKFHKTMEKS